MHVTQTLTMKWKRPRLAPLGPVTDLLRSWVGLDPLGARPSPWLDLLCLLSRLWPDLSHLLPWLWLGLSLRLSRRTTPSFPVVTTICAGSMTCCRTDTWRSRTSS
jgi:hypothetical protein